MLKDKSRESSNRAKPVPQWYLPETPLEKYVCQYQIPQEGNTCGLVAQLVLLNAMKKSNITEKHLIEAPLDILKYWYVPGLGSLGLNHVLSDYKIEVEPYKDKIHSETRDVKPKQWLEESLTRNRGIIVRLNFATYYYGTPAEQGDRTHNVVVTGIHIDRNDARFYTVIDSNFAKEGSVEIIRVDGQRFERAWKARKHRAVRTKESLPV